MNNSDEKSASSAEARLKKGIAQGSISVRTKKHTIKSTPIKIKSHFFEHQADELDAVGSPFTAKLLIENEGHEDDVEDYNVLIYGYDAEAFREGTPNSDIDKLGGFQSLRLGEDEHGESGPLLAAGAILSESDNESGSGIVKKSGNSSDEGLSSESSLQRGKVSSEAVYVRTEVDYRTSSISLAVSRLRPDTYLGRQQGAHITAYAVFIISILESVDEQSIHEIPELLAVIAKKFISEERWAVLDAKLLEISHNIPQHFDQKRRRVITRDLKQVSIFSKETVQEIKLSLKVRQATYLAQLINMISQEVLEGINQNRHRLYQCPQKKSKQDLGQEGARIKNALKCLRAMQHLIKWKLSNKKATEIPEILKKGSVRQGHEFRTFLEMH